MVASGCIPLLTVQQQHSETSSSFSVCHQSSGRPLRDGEGVTVCVTKNGCSDGSLKQVNDPGRVSWYNRWCTPKGVLEETYTNWYNDVECSVKLKCMRVGNLLVFHCVGFLDVRTDTREEMLYSQDTNVPTEPTDSCLSQHHSCIVSPVHTLKINPKDYVTSLGDDGFVRCHQLAKLWLLLRNYVLCRMSSFVRKQIQGEDYCSLSGLMPELLLQIFAYLDFYDLCTVSQLSKRFYALANHNELWKPLFGQAEIVCRTKYPMLARSLTPKIEGTSGEWKRAYSLLYVHMHNYASSHYHHHSPFYNPNDYYNSSWFLTAPEHASWGFPADLSTLPAELDFSPWTLHSRVPGMRHISGATYPPTIAHTHGTLDNHIIWF
eukprot:CFRG6452T1